MSESVDIHQAFLENVLNFYSNPPENDVIQIGIKDPSLVQRVAESLYTHNDANPIRGKPLVKPGNKPELYIRWAFRSRRINMNLELAAADNHIGVTVLGSF